MIQWTVFGAGTVDCTGYFKEENEFKIQPETPNKQVQNRLIGIQLY